MTGAQSVTFSYWRWFSNDQGSGAGEDYWDVDLSNDGGQSWTSLEHTQVSSNAWASQAFDLADYHGTPGLVQLRFVAADEGTGSIVEGAVDDFSIAGIFDATGTGDLPLAFELAMGQNYPNPFNPKTSIRFDLPEAQVVRLDVFDAEGRHVIQLLNEFRGPGYHSVAWNGRDGAGALLASGVYFTRIEAGPLRETSKMLLLK